MALHARLLAPELGPTGTLALVCLAAAGTFVVYGLDRVRGIEEDQLAWPDRAAFAQRHRRALDAAIAVAGLVAFAAALHQPAAVWGVCAIIGALGLAHRRLKARPRFKIAYLTLAWWSIVVGLPAVHADPATSPGRFATVGLATALALLANLAGSNASRAQPLAFRAALGAAACGTAIALAGDPGAHALAWVPAAQGVALWPTQPGERARLWRVDGSLAVGAILALATLSWG